MARPELGTKRTCINCGSKFYDLGKTPAECPKCEAAFVPEVLLPSKETAPVESKPAEPAKEEVKQEDTGDIEVISLDDVEDDVDTDEDDEIAAIADVDLGDDEDDTDTDDDDNTFLETDNEDDEDVTGFIGGVKDDDDG